MAVSKLGMVIVLNELRDDEKPHRGKTRKWIKRNEEKGYFSNMTHQTDPTSLLYIF